MTDRNRVALWAAAVVLAFLAGFGWQWLRARGLERELEATTRALALERVETSLAAAALAAGHGGHDVALELASQAFTLLQAEIERAPAAAAAELRAILASRDQVIAAVSRQDPESAGVLARLFVRYRIALGGPDEAVPVAASPPSAPGP